MEQDPELKEFNFHRPVNFFQYISMAFKMTVYWYGRYAV